MRRVGHGGQFDDVGVQSRQIGVDFSQVVGRFLKVVIADDAFCFSVARDRGGGYCPYRADA